MGSVFVSVFLWWPWECLCVFKDSRTTTYSHSNGVTKPASSSGQSKCNTKQFFWRENKATWIHSGTLYKFKVCDLKWFVYPITRPYKSAVNHAFHVQSAAHSSSLASLWEKGNWARAGCCSEATFRRSWLCIELLFLQGELEGAGGGYMLHRKLSCRQLSTFQQEAVVLSQPFSFCAESVRRTEADTGLRYRNLSCIPGGNVIHGVKFMHIMKQVSDHSWVHSLLSVL